MANWLPISGIPLALLGPVKDPVLVFLILLTIMLVAPLLFERLHLPGIIGLILAGLVVGPYGLGILQRDGTIVLLGTVGLLFLMFMAGLETSLEDLKLNAGKASVFGVLTFLLPMVIGTAAMLALGYGFLAAVLVASCFASHTLIALPIVSKLGLMRLQAVTATLGATLITNVLALLVLAVVVRAHQGELTLQFWLTLIPSIALYAFATLWGVPQLGGWFFQRFGHDEGAEFTFVIATLFVVAYGAGLIGIEPVVGAFLAGTAITPLIPQLSPLMNRIQFIGNTLFIPFFLISVGMLINPSILLGEPRTLLVGGVTIAAEVVSKFLAAWIPAQLFGWRLASAMVMFGLSVAQAAATLAAITVAFNVKLVDELTVNGTIAMILVTCIASPWIVARWGERLQPAEVAAEAGNLPQPAWGSRVLVPVANPDTESNLLRLALILAKKEGGTLLPLHVLSDCAGISPAALARQEQLLTFAEALAHSAAARVEAIRRVDDDHSLGNGTAGNLGDPGLEGLLHLRGKFLWQHHRRSGAAGGDPGADYALPRPHRDNTAHPFGSPRVGSVSRIPAADDWAGADAGRGIEGGAADSPGANPTATGALSSPGGGKLRPSAAPTGARRAGGRGVEGAAAGGCIGKPAAAPVWAASRRSSPVTGLTFPSLWCICLLPPWHGRRRAFWQ